MNRIRIYQILIRFVGTNFIRQFVLPPLNQYFIKMTGPEIYEWKWESKRVISIYCIWSKTRNNFCYLYVHSSRSLFFWTVYLFIYFYGGGPGPGEFLCLMLFLARNQWLNYCVRILNSQYQLWAKLFFV